MSPLAFTQSLQRYLGIRVLFSDDGCPQHTRSRSPPGADNHHADTCVLTGLQSLAHHDLTHVWKTICTEAGVTRMTVEDATVLNGPRAATKRAAMAARASQRGSPRVFSMDLVIPHGALHGASSAKLREKQVLLDITIRSVAAPTIISSLKTHQIPGAAATKGQDDKMAHYEGTYVRSSQTLVPLVSESYGRLGPSATWFLGQLVEHWASRLTCVTDDEKASLRAAKLGKFKQMLSVGLQNAMARREALYLQMLRTKQCSNVPVLDLLWDMADSDGNTPDGPSMRSGSNKNKSSAGRKGTQRRTQ